MKTKRIITILQTILASILVSACINTKDNTIQKNAVYYWKTTFKLGENEKSFLSKHNISKLYLRMFDVALDDDNKNNREPVPIATIKFESAVPDSLEVVPTVFITLDALKRCEGNEAEMAGKILKRVSAICSYNDIKNVQEVQFDCDWTSSTRGIYKKLCEAAKEILHEQHKELSGTIRLHQVAEAIYPFDRGVLMLYNTGTIKDPDTGNSIISYEDINKYLGVKKRINKFKEARKNNCSIIDFAYPTFSWGVVYHEDGKFDGLIDIFEFENQEWLSKESETKYVVTDRQCYNGKWYWEGQFIRTEYSDIKEVLKVKDLVNHTLRDDKSSNIIYHLDSKNLFKYSDNEIENILR